MLEAWRILTAALVGLAACMGVAHVLELPGKLRLTQDQYRLVQPIYSPGFTIGGFVGEFCGIVAAAVLVALTPPSSDAFWPTVGALATLLIMQASYWLITHPVNRFWLTERPLRGAGATFFRFGVGSGLRREWRDLRDQWEMSHVIRAILALAALSLLFLAMTS
jgi:hypothetical protein